jgi:hypothetical protein
VLGLAFSMSSTTVVLHLLEDRRERHSSWGEKTSASCDCHDLIDGLSGAPSTLRDVPLTVRENRATCVPSSCGANLKTSIFLD